MLSQTHLQLLQGRARIAKIHILFGPVRSIDASTALATTPESVTEDEASALICSVKRLAEPKVMLPEEDLYTSLCCMPL